MYRLIVTDLDGTLVSHDLNLSERIIAAFARARQAKLKVTIATGRMFRAALPYARQLGITVPLITYQGAWVRDPVTLETWWHHHIPDNLTDLAIKLIRETGLHLNLYRQDCLLVEKITPECEWYCQQARVTPEVVCSFAAVQDQVTKLVAIATPEILDRYELPLKQALQDRLYVVRSTRRYLEFAASGVAKGLALAELAKRFDISPTEIVAFGDADNDAEMLQLAGLGVAVGDASLAARASAKRHVMPVGEGVAAVIEELLT
ncbi:MAG: HAD family phosphatase [Cyanobacteria bacterium NC_groundwater_1444_Ag_S-0.65um_54_12]|nr:HAD family phosphatase [Cyanobacteria bacterium NC_groundwater_1444_Ag_S-0.65um_54_12]